MIKALLDEIAAHGDQGAVVPVSRFEDLKREMEDLRSEANHAFSDWMAGAMAIPSDLGFEPQSIIVVVTPSPKVMLQFNHLGKPVQCIVPPYYTDENTIGIKVLDYINACLTPFGFASAEAGQLPQKLLAVRTGLNLYGRNNVSFNEKLGSYMRILAYVSDLPGQDTPWYPSRRMDACEHCRACVDACPTKAIDPNNRLIDAHSCLTLTNELPSEIPDRLPKAAHNSLVGCMKCQDCCPGNAHVKTNITQGVTFTQDETAELLSHTNDEPFLEALAGKLEAAGLSTEYWPILPRNLAALLR